MPDPVKLLLSSVGEITTTNAVQTTAATLDFPPNCGGLVRVVVIARDTATGDVVYVERRALVKANAATLSIVGTPSDVGSGGNASLAACAVALDATGLSGRIRVTGIAGKTISWLAEIKPNIIA